MFVTNPFPRPRFSCTLLPGDNHMQAIRLMLFIAAVAAAAAAQPEFEVASVKPAAPVTGHFQYHMTMKVDAAMVDIANASVTDLVRTAYRVNSYQIAGPDWMAAVKYDVVAKLPAAGAAKDDAKDQIPEMLQALLAARFQLAVHHATQERLVRALVAGKSGARLKESRDGAEAATWSRSMGSDGSMHVDARNMSMPALAQALASFLDWMVVDATGLKGAYDVPLDFTPDDLRNGAKASGAAPPPEMPSDGTGSSISASLQRLGLKLESRRMPIDIIVIDHVDKTPVGN
jgi:uncharacterized protein (TIGR03435 family)